MEKIKVTRKNGDVHFILVDDADFEKVSKHKWYVKEQGNTFYAQTDARKPNGERTTMKMHRLLVEPKKGKFVDHANRNGLDNRKDNLRVCTPSQNAANSVSTVGHSKYKGVGWHKAPRKWRAYCRVNGKNKHLGYFDSEDEAAREYDRVAIETFGEFALVNFPNKQE